MEVEGELPDMNAEEMAKEGLYLVKSVLRHRYHQGWRFLTLWERFGVKEATWEPFSAFVLPEGHLNAVLVDYLAHNNLGELLRLAETLASKTKARNFFFLRRPVPTKFWAGAPPHAKYICWGYNIQEGLNLTPKCATYVCVCLTSLPGVAPESTGFADVGPKVLVSY